MAIWKDQIKILKEWGAGDLIKQEASFPLDGTANYNHIEALTGSDPDNHISIRRSIRSLMENEERLRDFFNAIVKNMAASPNNSAVIPAVSSELEIREEDIIPSVDENKIYIRVRPGVAIIATSLKTIDVQGDPFDYVEDFIPVVVKPQISIAERELEKVFNLQTWSSIPEGVEIVFDEDRCLFHAQIKKKNTFGNLQAYNFINDSSEFKNFSSSQASTTLTSNAAASIAISTAENGSFGEEKGNGIEIVFADTGVGNLSASYSSNVITIDFGGDVSATANEIAVLINGIEGFESSEVESGDFTVADDIALTTTLAGGILGGFKNSVALLKAIKEHSDFSYSFNFRVESLGSVQLEPIFEIPVGEASVVRFVGLNINGELIITEDSQDLEVSLCSFNLDTTDINNIVFTSFDNSRNYFSDILFRHNVRILGDFTVSGTTISAGETTTNSQYFIVNDLEPQPATSDPGLRAGIRVKRGSTENDYLFEYRESDNVFTIGEEGDMQVVGTRQDSPVNMGVSYWNNSLVRFDTVSDLTWNNSTKILSADKITSNSFNKVAITAPATSSTLTIANGKTLTASATTTLALNSITLENTKSLTIQYASLTVGDSVGTGNLTIKSNNASDKILTLDNNLTVNTLTSSHVLFAGSANTISGEAQLDPSRGGTGVDNANRTLTINNVSKTLSGNGSTINTSHDFTTSGGDITLSATATTTVTLPTSGTLSTLDNTEALTNKTVNGLIISTGTNTFTLTKDSSTIVKTGAHSLTLTTDGATSATFPSGTITLATRNTNNTFTGNNSFNGVSSFTNNSNIGVVFRRTSATDGIEILPSALGTDSNKITLALPVTPIIGSRTYIIPDVLSNSEFVMTNGNQSISGTKTFNGTVLLPTTGGSVNRTIWIA